MDLTLEASLRPSTRKGAARKGRAAGTVPAVVYGPTHATVPVSVDPVRLQEIFKGTGDRNTVLSVKVGDAAPVSCMVREVQRHPVSRQILHVDLYAVPEHAVTVAVPIAAVGRPKGALIGGRLRTIRRSLTVRCRYDLIPKALEVDITPLDVGDVIRVSQIATPAGVQVVYDSDFPVLSIIGKVQKEVEEVKPAAAAPAAAPADKA